MSSINQLISAKRYQIGLSLIELMVSLGLGLFISAAAIQVFVGSRQSHDVIQAQSSMQEGARFAIYFIASSVRVAGYINPGELSESVDDVFASSLINKVLVAKEGTSDSNPEDSPWEAYSGFEADAVVSGSAITGLGSVTVKSNTDTLTIRYQGDSDGLLLDCEGIQIDPAQNIVAVTSFFVSSDDQLYCKVDVVDTDTNTPTSGTAVALVAGIEDMKVLYGLGNPEVEIADRFLPAQYKDSASMTTDDWKNVSAVRLGLLAASENASLVDGEVTLDFLGEQITPSDGKARQVFSQTIDIRGI